MNIQMLFGVFLTQRSAMKQGGFSHSIRVSRKKANPEHNSLVKWRSAATSAKGKLAEHGKTEEEPARPGISWVRAESNRGRSREPLGQRIRMRKRLILNSAVCHGEAKRVKCKDP